MRDLTHHGKVDINYVLHRPNVPSDVLVVSFPGRGGAFAASQLGYTYIMTVGTLNVNALFLRSDNNAEHGENAYSRSFMTCINRDFKIERSVVDLIRQTCDELNCTRVVSVGSSMGGFCSLYYGLKYDWEIISGAPPYSLKTLASAEYMAGGTNSEDEAWCDLLLPVIIKDAGARGFNKHLFVMWGKGENNYTAKEHAPRLLKDLKKAGIAYTLKLEEYDGYSAIHHLFPNILKHQLAVVLGLASADEEPDVPPAEKILQLVGKAFKTLQGQTAPLADAIPNYSIASRTTWGDAHADIKLRTFVYGAQGYHWLPKLKVPYQVPGGAPNVMNGSDFFWTAVPLKNGDYATAFWYQQTLLNHYKDTGDIAVFRLLDLNTRMFVFQREAVAKIAEKEHNSWWTAVRRLWYLLDFSCIAKGKAENVYTSFDVSELKPAVLNAVNLMCAGEIKPADSVGMYRRLLATLHAAQYYKNNAEFYEQAYSTVHCQQVKGTTVDKSRNYDKIKKKERKKVSSTMRKNERICGVHMGADYKRTISLKSAQKAI
jgi:hypothetical protein